MESSRRWGWIALIAAGVFGATALVVWMTGVSAAEWRVFHAIVGTFDRHGTFFRWCTGLGSGRGVLIAGLFLLVLLPGPSLRRWWLWILVLIAVAALEGWGKTLVGRPRPEAARAGFPSGHTALAAAFYPMVAYIATQWVRSRLGRRLAYGIAGLVVLLVAVSRIVRWMHWPLDVAGGAALGVSIFATAVWWYERYPARQRAALARVTDALRRGLHRHQHLVPVPFFALALMTPAMGVGDFGLDVAFDVVGAACIAAALWLHLWAVQQGRAVRHAPGPPVTDRRAIDMRPAAGPYRHMRHPSLVVYVLIGAGLAVLAERGLGLVLIPAILITVYRAVAHVEEEGLAQRFGPAYAERVARVPLVPWPTASLLRDAARACPWRVIPRERRFVALTLLLAVLADLSEAFPRLF